MLFLSLFPRGNKDILHFKTKGEISYEYSRQAMATLVRFQNIKKSIFSIAV